MSAETLVDGVTVLVTAEDGTVGRPHGLYHRDTRHLSAFEVSFDGAGFEHLGSSVDGPSSRTMRYAGAVPRVNEVGDSADADRVRLVLSREQTLVGGIGLHERIDLANHSPAPLSGTLTVGFDVDFADVFEVRGSERRIDRDVATRVAGDAVRYGYSFRDADGETVQLSTDIGFSESPERLEAGRADLPVALAPQETATVFVAVEPGTGPADDGPPVDATSDPSRRERTAAEPISPLLAPDGAVVRTGERGYDRTFSQAAAELRALAWRSEQGPVPVAGSPWFATVFGRDALITAYQTLPVAPELARGTLRYLAAHRGRTTDEERDEEPGKVLHEFRHGELAQTGAIPHRPYYGTVDATPLWVGLLHETYAWTGDRRLVESLWEPFEDALGWIERATARIGDDPFLYYRRTAESGLVHKAWRDSAGGVRFADGKAARSSLAGVEVQGYVYDALTRAASLLRDVADDPDRAEACERRADTLRDRFDDAFWLPEREYYGVARTEDGEVVDSLASNVGHCLWSGIVDDDRAPAVADRLLSAELFSGWGVRTTSTADSGYSPVSYHAGSVWPHDTSLVALGLAGYGFHDAVETVSVGLLDASTRFDRYSLPELFCGFDDAVPPVAYPAACRPQAWSAGAPFALLRALFGFDPGEDHTPRAGRDPTAIDPAAIAPLVEAWASPSRLRGDAAG